MNTAYSFSDLEQLLNFLECFWGGQSRPFPRIYMTPSQEYAIQVDETDDFPDSSLSHWKAAKISFSHAFKEVSSLDILSRIRLKPWGSPRDFSDELLVLLKGNRSDFETLRDYLFGVEHGAEPPFKIESSVVKFEPDTRQAPAYLFRLQGLHAYGLLENWLGDPAKYEIYYPHAVTPYQDLRHAGLYLPWGFCISDVKLMIFDQAILNHTENRLILLNQDIQVRYFVPDFQPLFYFHNIEVANSGIQVQGKTLSLDTQKLFDIKLQLRPQYDSSMGFEYSEAQLLEHIDLLTIQLERLRLKSSAVFSPRIYVYEDGGLGMPSLQDFILRLPVIYLNQYQYIRMELGLDSRQKNYHFIVAKSDSLPDSRKPFGADYEFYKWNQRFISGYNIYLPLNEDGQKLVLFPPIFPETEKDEERCMKTLLGQYAQVHFRGSQDCVLLWPEGENILQVHLPLTAQGQDLGKASAAINTNFVLQKNAQIKTVPSLLESTLRETFNPELGKLKELSDSMQISLERVWKNEQGKIYALFDDVKKVLLQAEQANRQVEQIRNMHQTINNIQEGNLGEWHKFVARVEGAHQSMLKLAEKERNETISSAQSTLANLQKDEQQLTSDTLAQVRDLQSALPNIKPKGVLLPLRQQVASLLADIDSRIKAER